jgi:hypothetical protein
MDCYDFFAADAFLNGLFELFVAAVLLLGNPSRLIGFASSCRSANGFQIDLFAHPLYTGLGLVALGNLSLTTPSIHLLDFSPTLL